MKQTIKRTIMAGAALALLASPAVVLAKDGVSGGDDTTVHAETESSSPSPSESPRPERVRQLEDQLKDRLEKQQEQIQSKLDDKKAELEQKLDDGKKKACENHVSTINKLMTVMDQRRTNALGQITKIANAVEAFKVKKNLDVANYTDLVAKVDAAKAVAESAVQAQQQIPSLDCSGEHPRADVADFKDKRSASTNAVKAYRDAVKDLVKAVKAAAEAQTTSPSPEPTGGNQ